jgi:hypothetical protein
LRKALCMLMHGPGPGPALPPSPWRLRASPAFGASSKSLVHNSPPTSPCTFPLPARMPAGRPSPSCFPNAAAAPILPSPIDLGVAKGPAASPCARFKILLFPRPGAVQHAAGTACSMLVLRAPLARPPGPLYPVETILFFEWNDNPSFPMNPLCIGHGSSDVPTLPCP